MTISVCIFSQTLQLRVKFVKHEAQQERMWEDQHEWAADRLYSLCTELGGFFLKVKHLIWWCSESLGNFLFAWCNELQ
jgi:aarF domain-containing kinase